MSQSPPAAAEPQKTEPSSWKPYVVGLLIGAVALTVLPLLQKRFLKAPPPVAKLESWSAPALGGADVGTTALRGKVTLLAVENQACEADCVARVEEFGAITRHVDDLGDKVVLVTLVGPAARGALEGTMKKASPAWRFAADDSAVLPQLQTALVKFLGADSTDFARSHGLVLIDQNDAVRGFWQADTVGRGNAINAARLLAKHGPNP